MKFDWTDKSMSSLQARYAFKWVDISNFPSRLLTAMIQLFICDEQIFLKSATL